MSRSLHARPTVIPLLMTARAETIGSAGAAGREPSGGGRGELVFAELDEDVGGGDQAPLRAHRGSASSVEALHAAGERGLRQHGLDKGRTKEPARKACELEGRRPLP